MLYKRLEHGTFAWPAEPDDAPVVLRSSELVAIEKALAGEGLLAHVVVAKYVDHLPLYRLDQIFAREQIDLSRPTLCDWVADVATALTPIGDQLRREVTATDYCRRTARRSRYSTSAAAVTSAVSGPTSTCSAASGLRRHSHA